MKIQFKNKKVIVEMKKHTLRTINSYGSTLGTDDLVRSYPTVTRVRNGVLPAARPPR